MKPVITKPDVAKAIEALKNAAKKPTIAAIHAALGNKGSISTVVKLKAEIEADAVDQRDSEAGLRAFRELWALAITEGKKQKEGEAQEMRQALDAMVAELQKVEGESAASAERILAAEKQRDSVVSELVKANEHVTAARDVGEENASKLAAALERMAALQDAHAKELAHLRQQLDESRKRAHDVELKLARAEAKLEK